MLDNNNIWYKVRHKQGAGSAAEQTWGLHFLSAQALAPAQKFISAYVPTMRAHGSPARFPSGSLQSPHSPDQNHTHCPLCCNIFQSALRILPSLILCSILKVSHHLQCQVKPVPQTRTVNTFHCRSNLHVRSKNKIMDVTDMRSLTKLIPGSFLASQTPATLCDCYSGESPQATRFWSFCYICCQANCRPCTLWFRRVV